MFAYIIMKISNSVEIFMLHQLIKNKLPGILCLLALTACTVLASALVFPAQLSDSVTNEFGYVMQIVTYSAGSEGVLFTLFVLCLGVTWTLKGDSDIIKKGAQLTVQLFFLLVLSFAGKSLLKDITQSPRPYTELLAEYQVIKSPQYFYQLDQPLKDAAIDDVESLVSSWRTMHWHGEKDYSFPSGHTIFVAICVTFFGGLMVKSKQYFACITLVTWATSVAVSRLWLGMHRPVDLYGSMTFALMLYCIVPSHLVWLDSLIKKLPPPLR
jgi:phosphatidylglycerophosphatase B